MPNLLNRQKPRSLNRRELLKLSPLLVVGGFAIPKVREPLLAAGVNFTDWASAKWFRRDHLAPTFAVSELDPLEKFYVNTYDVDDPEVDLEKWTLTVSGDVERPGEYTLAQIQSLSTQNSFMSNAPTITTNPWTWLLLSIRNHFCATRCTISR
jgi:DMSO/TMAO reductase YedYZ molybdopterin-dependent catalytic subunit